MRSKYKQGFPYLIGVVALQSVSLSTVLSEFRVKAPFKLPEMVGERAVTRENGPGGFRHQQVQCLIPTELVRGGARVRVSEGQLLFFATESQRSSFLMLAMCTAFVYPFDADSCSSSAVTKILDSDLARVR